MAFLLSLITALLSGLVPWGVARVKRGPIALALALGIALSVLSAALSLGWYPWSNLIVLLVALSAGVLLGRAMPASTWPFLILLVVLSVLDVAQIALASHSAAAPHTVTIPAPGQLVGNVFLLLPSGHFNIGIFDIFIIAAISERGRTLGHTLALALLPGVLGIVLAFAILQFIYHGTLPLIPFLTLGWLCSLPLATPRKPATAQSSAHG